MGELEGANSWIWKHSSVIALSRFERIVTILDGDPNTDTKGMRVRLRELELTVASLEQKAQYVKWVGVGLVMQVALLAAITALVARLFGALP